MPAHLKRPLLQWIFECLDDELAVRIGIQLRLVLDGSARPAAGLRNAAAGHEDVMLSVIDLMLKERLRDDSGFDFPFTSGEVVNLEEMLETGGSAWRVALEGDGLARRVSPQSQALYELAAGTPAPAASYLRKAWNMTYGREPRPTQAVSEAIRAVEDAAGRVITPNDERYQLNKVAKSLLDQRGKFEVAYGPDATDEPQPIDVVASMMQWLIRAQGARHGGPGDKPVEHSQQEAEMAIQMAVLLVAWFSGGYVRRIDGA